MRILYFTERDGPHDRRFLGSLASTVHQVFSLRMNVCNPCTPDGITELTWPGDVPDWACWQGWQAGESQLKVILKELQPDLVHTGPIQGPAFLAALVGFHPLVTMSWGFDLLRIADRSPWTRFATTFTLANSDLLLADWCTRPANPNPEPRPALNAFATFPRAPTIPIPTLPALQMISR